MCGMRKTVACAGRRLLRGTVVVLCGGHTGAGERGMLARPQRERKLMLAEEQLALLEKHQTFLSHRIGLMHKGGVDADILAETARAELGLYAPNDVIV